MAVSRIETEIPNKLDSEFYEKKLPRTYSFAFSKYYGFNCFTVRFKNLTPP